MKVAIIGSGNAGCAHACMFTEAGHNVNLIKTSYSLHDENFEKAKSQGGLYYEYNNETKFAHLNLITRDLSEGLDDIDIVVIMTQTLHHKNISLRIKEYISKSVKLILVIPGYLGSLYFKDFKDIIVAEGESTPFDARIITPGKVQILFKNIRNAIGVYPLTKSKYALDLCRELTPTYHSVRTNIIESALHNPNLVVHTIGAIMSASRIEYSKGEFWMYKEAFTPSIWNLIDSLDKEKNLVIEAFGGKASPYLEECKFRNESDMTVNAKDAFTMYANEGGPKGPSIVNSRYVYEDVPMGLVLLESLGKSKKIETPVTSALINIASALLNTNFRLDGRTVNCLKLDVNNNDLINKICGI
ncbi:NAD/NADP octopine/nopaline dehydrogenase family protein [Photobacterium toruni]|uniref:NAD/NADP octopine/nopaline dehydrogenase family protein n=1 Tax=Photobacterium toruni TaxID=1935446 RepID=UPI002E175923|nr:NAD/NADP octopine/nopaline dehydrogenase family protein [Photobacterium toruni]